MSTFGKWSTAMLRFNFLLANGTNFQIQSISSRLDKIKKKSLFIIENYEMLAAHSFLMELLDSINKRLENRIDSVLSVFVAESRAMKIKLTQIQCQMGIKTMHIKSPKLNHDI